MSASELGLVRTATGEKLHAVERSQLTLLWWLRETLCKASIPSGPEVADFDEAKVDCVRCRRAIRRRREGGR